MEKFKRRFYDSHPWLPVDPDGDRFKPIRPVHSDPMHIAVVAVGAFFGTLLRYDIGLWIPVEKDGWPVATFFINITGAFLLGLLLQALLHRGTDEGARRVLRLLLGTGFLGAFTTYSSLATSTVLLAESGHVVSSVTYVLASVMAGTLTCALGIWAATRHRNGRRGRA